MVIAFHWLDRLPPFSLLETSAPHRWAMADSLWAGVDLFFVISGFLIGGILLDHRDSPSLRRTFYIRRACQILPLYLLLVAVDFSPLVADWPNKGEQSVRGHRPRARGKPALTELVELRERREVPAPCLVAASHPR